LQITDDREFTVDDILARPHKYGLPTFAEYVKKREQILDRSGDLISQIDAGKTALNESGYLRKIKFQYGKHVADSMEKFERILDSEGIDIADLEIMPRVIPEGSYKCTIIVEYMTQPEFQRRRAIDRAEATERLERAKQSISTG
jgi:hypothetical protein